MAAGYRYSVGDLRTGKITRPVDLVGSSWSVPLGEPGSIEGSFPMRAEATAAEIVAGRKGRKLWPDAKSDATAGKAFLLVEYENLAGDRTAIEAGPIWKSKFLDSSGVLSLSASGLGSYFDHRKVIKALVAGEDPSEVSETYTAKQLGLIAKRLIQLSQSHVGGSVPIVLPPDSDFAGTGEDIEKTYPGYELAWIGDALKRLAEDDRGPEIQFVPRRRPYPESNYIEWVMRIGTAATKNLLVQSGQPWTWTRDPNVPKSSLREIDISSDGTKVASRQWAAGQGQAEGRPIRKADALQLVDAGFPLLEGEATGYDAEDDPDTIQAVANAAVAYSQRPIESWTITVSRDSLPTVGQYTPGSWARIKVRDHDYLPDGEYEMRIMSMAGGDSDAVTLQLSERLGDL